MKKGYLWFMMTLALLPGKGWGQGQTETQTYTLAECLQYAQEHAVSVRNATLDERIASARVKETRGIGLPQVEGSVSLMYNQKLRRFFVSNTNDPNAPGFVKNIPGAGEGDIVAVQSFFQLPASGDAGISITQLLFNGSYFVGLKAANAYRDLAEKNSMQSREKVMENVSKAYYGVLINRERMAMFDNNISRVDSLLKVTRALNQSGFAESIDVDRIQVTLNNLVTERDKFENILRLTLDLLKFQMNYPQGDSLVVEGEIQDVEIKGVAEAYEAGWDYSSRSEYQVMEANRKLQELNIKNLYAAGLPTLAAFANLGYSTQSRDIAGLFKTNTPIVDNGVFGPDKWYSYSLFGISLRAPLFGGFQQKYRIQQQKLVLEKIENGFLAMKEGIELEKKNAKANAQHALKALDIQQQNLDLARKVSKVTRIKYENGVGSNLEVINAEAALKDAQVNFLNAMYDAIVARIDLDKAYGKLFTNEIDEK